MLRPEGPGPALTMPNAANVCQFELRAQGLDEAARDEATRDEATKMKMT